LFDIIRQVFDMGGEILKDIAVRIVDSFFDMLLNLMMVDEGWSFV
jgi:hypothetical protein